MKNCRLVFVWVSRIARRVASWERIWHAPIASVGHVYRKHNDQLKEEGHGDEFDGHAEKGEELHMK